MHTHIHTCTSGKNTKFCHIKLPEITLNYVNFASTIRLLEQNVKQLANQPAYLPRVQAPVHMLDGAPGVHHKRRPQGMTKMTQNTLNYS